MLNEDLVFHGTEGLPTNAGISLVSPDFYRELEKLSVLSAGERTWQNAFSVQCYAIVLTFTKVSLFADSLGAV